VVANTNLIQVAYIVHIILGVQESQLDGMIETVWHSVMGVIWFGVAKIEKPTDNL
tara:strand:- start:485 stop:649 length:165 start_codon:yes stop_codon:yes gene_type:complete